jgi:hypothetical protein
MKMSNRLLQVSCLKLLINKLIKEMLQEQADKMNFETKMRSFVRELIDPIMTKGKVDREMIFRLDKQRE